MAEESGMSLEETIAAAKAKERSRQARVAAREKAAIARLDKVTHRAKSRIGASPGL
jgi:hypothetical protein